MSFKAKRVTDNVHKSPFAPKLVKKNIKQIERPPFAAEGLSWALYRKGGQ